jgi:transcriptional regulator with XRE-family HTH domain
MTGVGTLVPKLARLRAIRDAQFMTQDELAERSGVHQVTISRIEQGDVEPRYKTIKRLAAALGVEPGELVGDSEE